MKSKIQFLALFSLIGIFAGRADAQATFTDGVLALDGSNVEDTGGQVIEAINFYSEDDSTATSAAVTLNGITFTAVDGTAGGADLSGPNYSLTNEGVDSGRDGGAGVSGSPVDALVIDGAYNFTGDYSQTLSITNLAAGTYAAQLFFDASDVRSASVTDGSVTSDSVTAGDGYGPWFITDSFTTTGGTESLLINDTSSYPLELSGFVVEAVPEPSSYGLMALGLGALVFATRRRLVFGAK